MFLGQATRRDRAGEDHGLDGKLGPAKAPGAGSGITHAGGTTTKPQAGGNAAAGKAVFSSNCSTCHGLSGTGGNGGPDLTKIPSAKQLSVVLRQVTNGGGGMPPFKGALTQQQINDVAAYVVHDITGGK